MFERCVEIRSHFSDYLDGICEREVPGDTHMNLQVQADYSAQTFKHILLPVWLLSFNYDGQSFQVVVNGVNGAIGGNYPKSWIKITLAVFFALVTIAIILLVLGAMQRH